jgi:hypothetical protein
MSGLPGNCSENDQKGLPDAAGMYFASRPMNFFGFSDSSSVNE